MGWTPETIKELKRLWNKGFTTVEIGNRLGMSKNAIVGKAHRLGLESRPSPIKRELTRVQIQKPKAKPAPTPKKAEKKPSARSQVQTDTLTSATVLSSASKKTLSKKSDIKQTVDQDDEITLISAVSPVFEAEPLPEKKVPKKPNHKGVALVDLKPDSCRWPEGDPKDPDFRFCGEPCAAGKIYCEEHCAVAYTGVFKAR